MQEAVTEAILGNYKILVVQIYYGQDDRPPSQIGKTFSTEIISDYLNLSLHQVVRMSAGRTKESAYKTATELLSAVSPDLVRDLPSEKDLKAESQSTQINDTIALLANKVCKILAGAATRRKLWVVIDELDLHPLTEGSTRLFFDRLLSGDCGAGQPKARSHRIIRSGSARPAEGCTKESRPHSGTI